MAYSCMVSSWAHNLQELLTPVVQTLITVTRLLGVCIAGVLHPFFEQLRVFLQYQVLSEHCVGLEQNNNNDQITEGLE